ncbi:MAG TPA: prephenate dehydrogenase [Actinomycetota bacterium]|nr:prephenate dehydrogenase [Actinomycetota bacterium]
MSRIAVIGTGLIGGSVALGLRSNVPSIHITGFDLDSATLDSALEVGAIDRVATSAADAASGAELVVLAIPVDRTEEVCRELKGVIGQGAVVTDVGSSKADAVAAGGSAFGPAFVGGHPMAGSERHGIDAADPGLFQDAWWILTPTPDTAPESYARVATMASSLGAKPIALHPHDHDMLLARLSHLPQLVASTLVDVAVGGGRDDAVLNLAASGFRDVTRIAASHPDMWIAIMRSNRSAVLEALGTLGERLEAVGDMISAGHWDDLRAFLETSRTARLELFAKPESGGEPVALDMSVPDRPGVLAEVTTAASALGVNIEDLRIIHSTEGGRGRLEVIVIGDDRAAKLEVALVELGYRVERSTGSGSVEATP